METARKRAPDLIKKDQAKKKEVDKKLCERMQKKQQDKEKREKKKTDTTAKLVAKVTKSGGMWENVNDMNEALEGLGDDRQYDLIADQLRLRKSLSTKKGDHKLFYLTHKSQKLTISALKEQMKCVLQSVNEEGPADNDASQADPEVVLEKVNEKVASKKRELHNQQNNTQVPSKKARSFTSLIGKKFQHKYDEVDDDNKVTGCTWYEGEVIRPFGSENDKNWMYEVKYTGDEELYEVEVQMEIANKCLVITK